MTLDSKICKKKYINNLFKKTIYKTRYKYFRSGIIYAQNWRVCELLKCILTIQKQLTNRPRVMTNQTVRPQVKIWDTWKTWKYLNINDSFHLKDLEISKYIREWKGRWTIKKNICHIIYFCNNTIIVQVRYIIIETKEFARIWYNGFLIPHEYSGEGFYAPRTSPEYSCGKRNPLYPIRADSFVSIVLYPMLVSLYLYVCHNYYLCWKYIYIIWIIYFFNFQ